MSRNTVFLPPCNCICFAFHSVFASLKKEKYCKFITCLAQFCFFFSFVRLLHKKNTQCSCVLYAPPIKCTIRHAITFSIKFLFVVNVLLQSFAAFIFTPNRLLYCYLWLLLVYGGGRMKYGLWCSTSTSTVCWPIYHYCKTIFVFAFFNAKEFHSRATTKTSIVMQNILNTVHRVPKA